MLYASTITSASLDAILAGLRVVQCLDPASFDLSPLRGDPRVHTVRTGAELADALDALAVHAPPGDAHPAADPLHLDAAIPRWRALLEGALA